MALVLKNMAIATLECGRNLILITNHLVIMIQDFRQLCSRNVHSRILIYQVLIRLCSTYDVQKFRDI